MSHPQLDGAEVHTALEMLSGKGRAEFVQEPVVATRAIGAGMIALVAVAAVEPRPIRNLLAKIEEMIVRPSTGGREHERRFQVLAGQVTFQRLYQAIRSECLRLFTR